MRQSACIAGMAVLVTYHGRMRSGWHRSSSSSRASLTVAAVRRKAEARDPSQARQTLSEDELLELELAEVDLDFSEIEEAEWKEYDQQVLQYEALVDAGAAPSPPSGREARESVEMDRKPSDEEIQLYMSALQMHLQQQETSPEGEEQDQSAHLLAALAASMLDPTNGTQEPNSGIAVSKMESLDSIPEEYSDLSEGDKEMSEIGEVAFRRDETQNCTVVYVSQDEDQLQLLPQLMPEAFRLENVRMVRGWMESTDENKSTYKSTSVYEVCDAETGGPLSKEKAHRLEKLISRQLQVSWARNIYVEMAVDKVPRLELSFVFPRPALIDEILISFVIIGFVRFLLWFVNVQSGGGAVGGV